MTESQDPIACTLTSADLAAQVKRWVKLMSRAMTERTETADGLRISFRPSAEQELRALAAVETECCSWAAWTVEASAGKAVLEVRSTPEGAATLHGMFR